MFQAAGVDDAWRPSSVASNQLLHIHISSVSDRSSPRAPAVLARFDCWNIRLPSDDASQIICGCVVEDPVDILP